MAEAIAATVSQHGGLLTPADLAAHRSTLDNPICVTYKDHRVWEMPPNGQGLTALLALNILAGFDLGALKHNSVDYVHVLIEALRLAFADTRWCVEASRL